MRNSTTRKVAVPPAEKNSERLLMEKMGMSKKEIREVSIHYGVTLSRLVELMTLSKYQFVYNGKAEGQCEPCHHLTSVRVVNF